MTKKILLYLCNHPIHIWLAISVLVVFSYLISRDFRNVLDAQGIDPNFLVGFFTIVALLLSIIQSGNDKRYGYNLSLTNALRSAGERVIGKIIAIRTKSNLYHAVIKHLHATIGDNAIFLDQNNIESKEDVERDMEFVAALVDIYFPELGQLWNDTLVKLTDMANIANNIYKNYQIHAESLKGSTEEQRQSYMAKLAPSIAQLESYDREIEEMTIRLRNGVATKMNKQSGDFQNTFRFRL